uniref:large ribosomal subunit protein bL12m n=1 Tax=Myxine glutinosa TaxID=7769 RepID=UPI00358F5D48
MASVRFLVRLAGCVVRNSTLRPSQLCRRCLGVTALDSPPLDGAPKHYSARIHRLADEVASLTLLEVADLNELLRKMLNIPDLGMLQMAGASTQPAQAAAEAVEDDDVPLKLEKTHFTVRLTEIKGSDKVKLIKEVKACIPGINLVQAKKLVESLPQEIKANVVKEEADKLKASLEAAGGGVVVD